MANPKETMQRGKELVEDNNHDMAAAYFERAADLFIEEKNYNEAHKALTELLNCEVRNIRPGQDEKIKDAKRRIAEVLDLIKKE